VKVDTVIWHPTRGWQPGRHGVDAPGLTNGRSRSAGSSLGIVVADLPADVVRTALRELGDDWHPDLVVGCSTVGQSLDGDVHDGSIVASVVELEGCEIVGTSVEIDRVGGPRRAGRKLAEAVSREAISGCLVFADAHDGSGDAVNGALIAAGIDDVAPRLTVAGAIAGDRGVDDSWVIADPGGSWEPARGWATIVGFTGDVDLGVGSRCGWEPFGPERLVTRSYGEILYELDGAPALPLYLEYLGDGVDDLSTAARLFPLHVRDLDGHTSVRTVVDVDTEAQSLRFAGDVVQGATAQLMCPPADSLVHHAGLAAKQASSGRERFALAISGAGRRRALGERIEDELDAARENLAPGVRLLGLHSRSELASLNGTCELRNETVTMLTLGDRPDREGAQR
jgi:hypothetical protein